MARSVLGGMLGLALLGGIATLQAQRGTQGGDWPAQAGDKGATRYSPIDQINKDTVKRLNVAWRRPAVAPEFLAQHPDAKYGTPFQSTPIMVDGVLYAEDGVGLVEAFDPGTGKTLWVQELPAQAEGAFTAQQAARGVAYSRTGSDERILSVFGHYLIATDPKTGKMIRGFGDGGKVDLGVFAEAPDPEAPRKAAFKPEMYRWRSAPIVVRDTVVVGSAISRPGDVRGYDVRTGKHKWTFHVIPGPGEFGNDTWLDGSWKGIQAGEADVWTMMSGDEDLGLVYLPTSNATNNMFGGHRPGANLFSSSIVAVRAETGERVWHFQTVHHDMFDYDNPTPPILVDITVDGRPIKALVQLTKQAFAYVLDRTNGKPVWPIEERPVPQTTVPGEHTSPTQPFPTKPAPYDRQGLTPDDVIDFTPELNAEGLAIAKEYVIGPLFNPPIVGGVGPNADKKGSFQLPGQVGGTNFGGGAFDPETGILYVPSRTGGFTVSLAPGSPDKTPQKYRGTYKAVAGPRGLPLTKPPYGRITAINMNTGAHLWMVPNGEGPREHPALKDLHLPRLGDPGHAMAIVTKSLLFVSEGDPIMTFTPPGGGGPADGSKKFRAYDKATGAVLWETTFPAGTNGSIMTYMHKGKQYVVAPIGSKTHPGEWVALSLPE